MGVPFLGGTPRDGSFSFFFYENDDEKKTKNELIVLKNDSFLMEIVLKKRSFSKRSLVVSLTIVNDDTLLTKRGNQPEGHRYLSLSSLKENIKKF